MEQVIATRRDVSSSKDIKSANILLDRCLGSPFGSLKALLKAVYDRHGTAKMADFGLSITSSAAAKGLKVETISGTPGYACPIYARTGQVTEFSEARG